jgi:hypothetical protein
LFFFLFLESFSQHAYEELDVVDEEIVSDLTSLLSSCDKFRAKVNKLDKQCWKDLDEVADDCQKWKKEVDKIRDEQVWRSCVLACSVHSTVNYFFCKHSEMRLNLMLLTRF